jgi:hypothetical protein
MGVRKLVFVLEFPDKAQGARQQRAIIRIPVSRENWVSASVVPNDTDTEHVASMKRY